MEMKLNETMSRHPVTVRHKDDLNSAFLRMRRDGFRHMPVIDDRGQVVGIISDRDFQRAMWPINFPDGSGLPPAPHFRKDAKVADYMSWPVKTFPEDANLIEAVNAMIAGKMSSVLITREEQIVGIVTHEDLLRVLASLLKSPTSAKGRVLELAYNTPLAKVNEMLSVAGL